MVILGKIELRGTQIFAGEIVWFASKYCQEGEWKRIWMGWNSHGLVAVGADDLHKGLLNYTFVSFWNFPGVFF